MTRRWFDDAAGSLLLDIGGEVGALVVTAPAALLDTEIEVAPVGPDGPSVHTVVRRHDTRSGSRYAGVFAALPTGVYRLTRPPGRDLTVTVRPGEVSWCDLPGAGPRCESRAVSGGAGTTASQNAR